MYLDKYPSALLVFKENENDFRRLRIPDEAEIIQFTGMFDKNGKEIYEGYIVECLHMRGEVEWGNYVFNDKLKLPCYVAGKLGLFDDREAEVIGNKFENPELLKEQTK